MLEVEEGQAAAASNAVLCPDYPLITHLARLLTPESSVRWLWLLFGIGAFSLVLVHWGATATTPQMRSALHQWWFELACSLACVAIFSAIIPSLRRALIPGGALERLGAGRAMISHADKRKLDRCSMACSGLFVLNMLGALWFFSHSIVDPDRQTYVDGLFPERGWDARSLFAKWAPALGCMAGGPVAIGGLLSIMVATTLGTDAVDDIIHDVKRLSPGRAEQWAAAVERPVIRLAEETIPSLSEGWGLAAGLAFPLMWSAALVMFTAYMRAPEARVFHLFAAAVCSLVPLAVAWPLAGTSTACEYLLDALNRKRLEDLGHHGRVEALETALRQLNRGKGLGFTLFGTVISHHVLKQLFAPLVTLGSPLLTFLSLAEAPAGHCALSDAGALAFQATAGLVNETCTYNLTVGPAGVNAN